LNRTILVITPTNHIENLNLTLEKIGKVIYRENPNLSEIHNDLCEADILFTNPNKSKIYIGEEVFKFAKKLKVIVTASTGTNHIDVDLAESRNIKIICLAKEYDVINKISSTAELAFSLTLAGIRNIVDANSSVLQGEWDYEKFIGRQLNALTVGVLGYGRLGKIYIDYCLAFGAKVLIYDPDKEIIDPRIQKVNSPNDIYRESDIISIHIHATKENINFLNSVSFSLMKKDVLVINTSRGDVVDEDEMVKFLRSNPKAKAFVDVLRNEITERINSPLYKYSHESSQVFITPHIGGMTREGQSLAYLHAAKLLKDFLTK